MMIPHRYVEKPPQEPPTQEELVKVWNLIKDHTDCPFVEQHFLGEARRIVRRKSKVINKVFYTAPSATSGKLKCASICFTAPSSTRGGIGMPVSDRAVSAIRGTKKMNNQRVNISFRSFLLKCTMNYYCFLTTSNHSA